jgi:hypothetical protein
MYCSAKLAQHFYSHNLSSQSVVCPQNVLFERRVASRPYLHVSPIFPRILCLMLQSCISPLVDWYSHDICCCDTSIYDRRGPISKSNIICFNCACATLICLNQYKQNGSHNTPLIELGRDQFNPLQFLLPRIWIKYTSLIGFVMLPQLCIVLMSSLNNVYSHNFLTCLVSKACSLLTRPACFSHISLYLIKQHLF